MAREGTRQRSGREGIERTLMMSMREAYGKTLVALGREREDIVVLDADLAESTKTIMFAEEFPDRFRDMGISEQDMMSTAAGLALAGKTVFVSSFAMFAAGRAYNQIRNNICYMNLNVKIVATHGGISVGEDGSSHQALEDLSLMRGLPNMRVIAPSDARQTEEVIRFVAEEPGPFYVRLVRPKAPVLYRENAFTFGRVNKLRDGKDVSIFAHGLLVSIALEAAEILKMRGISARVYDSPTIKPVDREAVLEAAEETGRILVAEDHSTTGGLGSAIAETVVQYKPIPMEFVGVEGFGQSGTPDMLFKMYGLTSVHIADRAEALLDRD